MPVLEDSKKELAGLIAKALGPSVNVGPEDLAPPPDRSMGDLSYGCFGAAKALGKPPAAVADGLAAAIKPAGLLVLVKSTGPYVNFLFDRAFFSQAVITEVLSLPDDYGSAVPPEKPEKIMIEYAQPNTHKEFHIGHLRNVCLGQAAINLCRAAGFEVVPVSYMGDIGAHVAKCLWCLRKFHEGEPVPEDRGKYLGQIYAEATRRIDEDEQLQLKKEVAEVQQKLEARDLEWVDLWRETRQWSIDGFEAIFKELGVEIERWYWESEVEEPGKTLVYDLLAKEIAEEGEQGAIIIDLEEYGLGIFLLLKSDGSSLYATKELALAQLKFREYQGISRSIHIVDSRQSLYFKQFFKTLELMGFDQLKTVHLAYEFVTLKEGAMSSRKGNIVAYEDFRDEMVARAAEETRKRRGEWDGKRIQETAWTVAEGAMKFGMLKQDPDRPIVFDIGSALSFDGFTGPYIQYVHARLSSILAKAGGLPAGEVRGSSDAAEHAVLAHVASFPAVVAEAAEKYKPSVLAQYLFDLAQAANDYYRDVPVLAAVGDERTHRLQVVEAVRLTLRRGLGLLGIKAPEEM